MPCLAVLPTSMHVFKLNIPLSYKRVSAFVSLINRVCHPITARLLSSHWSRSNFVYKGWLVLFQLSSYLSKGVPIFLLTIFCQVESYLCVVTSDQLVHNQRCLPYHTFHFNECHSMVWFRFFNTVYNEISILVLCLHTLHNSRVPINLLQWR